MKGYRRPNRRFCYGQPGAYGLSMTQQVQLWRAAAKGAKTNGDREGEARYLAQARLIESTLRLNFDTSPS